MRIVIAPDSFKGSLKASELCRVISDVLKRRMPESELVSLPLADGGEGTCEALVLASGGRMVSCTVKNPLMQDITASYGILDDRKTAVIEMAAASGLPLVPKGSRDVWGATSFGTGQLIMHALDMGCRKIIMGIGGSATNDGGAGMLLACGVQLLRGNGTSIDGSCRGLLELERIDISHIDRRIAQTEFVVACDVKNPLCGESGASAVFAPQKGAKQSEIKKLDHALSHFAEVIERIAGKSVANVQGAGAAGGMGAGLLAFMNATLRPGFEIISEAISLEQRLKGADLIITGEGQMNGQSIMGKLPVELAKLGARMNIPTIAVVGAKSQGYELAAGYFSAVYELIEQGMSVDYSVKNTAKLLAAKMMKISI